MQLLVLRARSSCALCRSKLPPRTEAWQHPDGGDVICVTCERMARSADAAPAAPVPPSAPVTDPVRPVAPVAAPAAIPPAPAPPAPEAAPTARPLAPADRPAAVDAPAPGPGADPAAPAAVTRKPGRVRVPKVRVPKAPPAAAAADERPPAVGAPVAEEPAPPPVAAPPAVVDPPRPSVPVHHDAPVPVAIDRPAEAATDLAPAEPTASKVSRLRPARTVAPDAPARADNVFDRVLGGSGAAPTLDPAMALPIRRGDMGEGRVGQTLEGARIQGLEVLHGVRLTAGTGIIDHLVVSANGLWVVRAVPVLGGRLERRDLGDWFNADPRLFVADEDRSELVALVRRQVEGATAVLARGSFSDIPVRGVLCFGSIQPGWVKEPFVLDGISVTWRSKVVEPMLAPVLVDLRSRTALLHALAASVVAPAGAAGDPSRQVG